MSTRDLEARARAWAQFDPDPETRRELVALLEAGENAAAELTDRFGAELAFGTAGLRGVLGAGAYRMNRFVVMRSTLGLSRILSEDKATGGVLIGYDGRRMSRTFAEDTACVLAGAGIVSHLFEHVVPTPVAAFAVTHLRASAGVMVTASHNPPEYNGYKVYWSNGAQIVPPIDARIAAAISALPVEAPIPRMPLEEARAKGLVKTVGEEVVRAYFDGVRALGTEATAQRSLSIAYTALHGVGDAFARRALAEAGFSHVVSVPEQREPDGAFPTVPFPNPEEKGAMDLVLQLASRMEADLVLANDPDADRLAVAVPDPASPQGYRALTGNQVGVLLGHYLLTERHVRPDEKRAVLFSIVSSPMLALIAESLGVRHEATLTGFKWIANRAIELAREGYRFVFGYEEALGYTVGDLVRDKDGVSAAMVMAELADALAARESSVLVELERLYRRYGLFTSTQVTVTRPGAAGIAELAAVMARLRTNTPSAIAAFPVSAIADYETGARRDLATGEVSALTLPRQNMLIFEFGGGSRVIARPSGTEPKVKFYVDLRTEIGPEEPVAAAEARAAAAMKRLGEAVMELATG